MPFNVWPLEWHASTAWQQEHQCSCTILLKNIVIVIFVAIIFIIVSLIWKFRTYPHSSIHLIIVISQNAHFSSSNLLHCCLLTRWPIALVVVASKKVMQKKRNGSQTLGYYGSSSVQSTRANGLLTSITSFLLHTMCHSFTFLAINLLLHKRYPTPHHTIMIRIQTVDCP